MYFKRIVRAGAVVVAAGMAASVGGCVDDGSYGGRGYGPGYAPAYGGVVEYGSGYRDRRPVFEPEYDRRRPPPRQEYRPEQRQESRPREESRPRQEQRQAAPPQQRQAAPPQGQESRPSAGIRGPIEPDREHGR